MTYRILDLRTPSFIVLNTIKYQENAKLSMLKDKTMNVHSSFKAR